MLKRLFGISAIIILGHYSLKVQAQDLVLPKGYPELEITMNNQPEPGYYFVCPQPMEGRSPGYLVITDHYGVPVFYRQTAVKTYCFRPYPNGYLAYFEGSIRKYVMMDSAYNHIDTMECEGCDRFDLHEIRITGDGHYFLAGKKFRNVDMSQIVDGGDPEATIEDYLIQEFDAEGNLVFEWNTEPHYAILDVNDSVDLTASTIDVTNFNAIVVDSDTSLLLSMAHQDEITRIDRRNGEVIWRMGGKNNDFEFINSTRPFTRQHHVRKLPNGNITVFDNGTFSNPNYARGVEYVVDEEAMTATQVWEFDRDKSISSSHKGSVHRLPGGNTLIGWGDYLDYPAVPAFTEVHPDGSIAFEAEYPGHDGSYRVIKSHWKTSLFEPNTESVDFPFWDGYTEDLYILNIRNNADHPLILSGYSVMTGAFSIDQDFPLEIPARGDTNLILVYYPMNIESGYIRDRLTIYSDSVAENFSERIAIQVDLNGTKQDTKAPEVEIPLNQAVNVSRDTTISVLYSEAVRKPDGTPLNYENVDELIDFRKTNESGEEVLFDAVINTDLDRITVIPEAPLEEDQTYYIGVSGQVEDYSGNQAPSASAFFSTGNEINAGNLTLRKNPVRVYPNPGKGHFRIELPPNSLYDLIVYDLSGSLIYNEPYVRGEYNLDLSKYAAQLYILKIFDHTSSESFVNLLIRME